MIKKLLACLIAFACSSMVCAADTLPKNTHLFTLQTSSDAANYLFFQGNVQPLRTSDVLAPIDGIVNGELHFHYGDVVKQGQYLLALSPSK